MATRVDSVPVPLFKAAKRGRAVFQTNFVDEHLRRRDDPRQVAGSHVADVPYPASGTFLKVEDPMFGAGVGDFTVRVAYKFRVTAAGINITVTSISYRTSCFIAVVDC